MANEALVSIIIPNYNNEKYLPESVNSVINQTYSNLEIIIVDDCSTDNSRAIIESLAKSDNRVRYHFSVQNQGVSSSRNIGISLSKGEYVSTLDSDDVYYPDKIEKEMHIINKNLCNSRRRGVVAFSNICIVDQNLNYIRKVMHRFTVHEGDIFKKMLYRSIPFGRDLLVSKEIITKVGLFNEERSLYEDWEHKLKLARICDFYFSGSNGIMYRQVGGGLSSVDSSKHTKSLESIFRHFAPKGNIELFRLINGRGLLTRILKRILYIDFINKMILK